MLTYRLVTGQDTEQRQAQLVHLRARETSLRSVLQQLSEALIFQRKRLTEQCLSESPLQGVGQWNVSEDGVWGVCVCFRCMGLLMNVQCLPNWRVYSNPNGIIACVYLSSAFSCGFEVHS